MIDSICRAQGYRTGLFTSPHLVSYRERIRVDGQMIEEQEVADGLNAIRQRIADWDPHPTFFEITTALAVDHFKRRNCELVVLETGLGGRLDATNAFTPIVSVLTPIGYDHQAWLGNTLEEIAAEKAGIIKPRVPVVSAEQKPAAENVIRARASECDAPLEFVTGSYSATPLSLAGVHQKENAALALASLRSAEIATDETAIVQGLANIHWPARFQRWDERTIIDGAHNPAGAEVLAKTWRQEFGAERATIILAVLREKDVAGMVRALAPIAQRVILPSVRTARALPPEEVAQIISTITPPLQHSITASLPSALDSARATPGRVLLTGSLHFAGEALATLSGDPAALEDCAQ
jgi:dihydrofolate synthase/folylpolyglutamate synthase